MSCHFSVQLLDLRFQHGDIVLDGLEFLLLLVGEFQLLLALIPGSLLFTACLGSSRRLRTLSGSASQARACAAIFPGQCFHVIRVAALILTEMAVAVKGKNPVCHIVQEIPVVGNENYNADKGIQVILQNRQRGNIQFVADLVHNQHIGAGLQDA